MMPVIDMVFIMKAIEDIRAGKETRLEKGTVVVYKPDFNYVSDNVEVRIDIMKEK